MKFKELKPMLWSDKLEESIDFYTKILGFTVGEQNQDWGWASLQKDGVEIMLAKPNEHAPFNQPVFTGTFYITTDNVDEIWEALKDRVKIVYGLENFEWQMREFAIYDNNGYMIQFGQDISKPIGASR
ncbi:MAG: VOC family protein [Limisphaerales bacterium]